MAKLTWLEIRGFRSFSVCQRLEFNHQLALLWGGNSQGKTSLAEAIEFLLTGDTVRRTLLGGDRSEFNDSLRCARHPQHEVVSVAAGIVDESGTEHRVVRTLDQDIGRGQDCTSTLTVDDTPVSDLSALGIVLAEPPLRAPVLFQHSVRYVLSARPIDRLAYFKALLEMSDLDALSDALAAVIGALTLGEESVPERDLAACRSDPRLAAPFDALSQGAPSVAAMQTAIDAAVGLALAEVTGSSPQADMDGSARIEILERELERHDQRRFDFSAWRPGAASIDVSDEALSRIAVYAPLASAADAEVERLRALFEAVLAVPALAEATDPTDCPVCGTEAALTPNRIEALKQQVAQATGLRDAQQEALDELSTIRTRLRDTRTAVAAVPPSAARFDDQQVTKVRTAAIAITGETLDFGAAHAAAVSLARAGEEALRMLDEVLQLTDAALEALGSLTSVDPSALSAALSLAVVAVENLASERTRYIAEAGTVLTPVKERLAEQTGTSAFAALIRIARDPGPLAMAMRRRHAIGVVRGEYEAAKRDIDRAKLAVFSAKFDSMSQEIVRWWALLRPDEPVRFHRAAPRGQGRRAVSLEAILDADGDESIVRDALGVLSDSQLNALGLSAFLARASFQRTPLLVLDDPVHSGDEAHRDTFIDLVVPELLSSGFQVLITTFDYTLNKVLTGAQALDGFRISLDDAAAGSVVVKGTHTADALLAEAKQFIHEGQASRATGAGRLRVAAEAVAKEILVAKRVALGERASLADYAGHAWTLDKLVARLQEHLTDDRERRWWTTVSPRLSPGAHEDAPPERNTLRLVYRGLKTSLKDHREQQAQQDATPVGV